MWVLAGHSNFSNFGIRMTLTSLIFCFMLTFTWPLLFITATACFLSQDMASWKGMLLRGPHVESVNYLELGVAQCLGDVQHHCGLSKC